MKDLNISNSRGKNSNVYFMCNFIRSCSEIQQTMPPVTFHGFMKVLTILTDSSESV